MTAWIGGAAAIAAAVALAVAWALLRARGDVPLGEGEAGAAAATIPGFTVRQALLGDDRRAALIVGERARVALVTAGRRPRAREVRWSDIRATHGGLHVATGEHGRSVFVAGVDVLDVRRAGDDDWRRR